MGSHSSGSRFLFCAVAMLVTVFATSSNAQGLFSGLPGLPSFGGFLGSSSACGEKLCPTCNLDVYVGWLDGQDGTTINVDAAGTAVAGLRSVHHKFANRGVSLGLGTSVCLSDRVSFLASGWYLIPNTTNSRELYNEGTFSERTWDVSPQWWYVDGVFALGQPCGGITVLAGLRYDSYNARIKNPVRSRYPDLPTDTADVTSEDWIPLIGTQYAVSGCAQSLVFRVLGIPTLVGNVRYKETIVGVERLDVKGNYKKGYFLEVFTQYTKNFCGGAVGLFGRWNTTQGNSDVNFDAGIVGATVGIPGQKYKLTLHRNAWTVGGVFSLSFNSPF